MKKIALLGSTGSIGTTTLQVARHCQEEMQIVALAAGRNVDLLAEQAREFSVKTVAIFDVGRVKTLQDRLPGVRVLGGMEGLLEVATLLEADCVVQAMVGSIGIQPTFASVAAGKTVALANKEALVAGGELLMQIAKKKKVSILPVDSEHSAIFQCLMGQDQKAIRRLILTASGGPFRNQSLHALQRIRPEEALLHPTWKMGPKITIDCSTLMNKGLEVIEAHWLFGVPVEQIEVLIHPTSIVHSFVEFVDGSLLAQMGEPSMVTPIQFALTYPKRYPTLLASLDWSKHQKLEFFPPDFERFRCLSLAFTALKMGKSAPCYLNAANEVLVNAFLQGKIGWLDIAICLETLLNRHILQAMESLEAIVAMDALAKKEARELLLYHYKGM